MFSKFKQSDCWRFLDPIPDANQRFLGDFFQDSSLEEMQIYLAKFMTFFSPEKITTEKKL